MASATQTTAAATTMMPVEGAADATTATTLSPTTTTPSALQDEDEAPRDEEGLRTHYDVIVCGTGLVQSILASALSRAGLSVLHCDASDYYGELDAVWTLPYVQQQQQQQEATFVAAAAATSLELNKQQHDTIIPLAPTGECQSLRIHSMESKMEYPIEIGTLLSTPYGPGKVVQLPQSNDATKTDSSSSSSSSSSDTATECLVFELTQWKLVNGCHPRVHVGIPSHALNNINTKTTTTTTKAIISTLEQYLQQYCSIEPVATTCARMILQERNRSLALDVTPAFVYAAGTAVKALLTSGVADYLEWKSVEGLLLHFGDGNNNNNNNHNQHLERVPCNKNDVFSSKLLGPMDKRRLMKFLQLAMDYGIILAEEEENTDDKNNKNETAQAVQSLNERKLNQGRSLARPQNKSVAADDMETLRASMDMPFVTYLQDRQRLSPKLIQLVRYALALESSSSSGDGIDDCQNNMGVTVREGMKGLTQHMASYGQFGTTAFLVPMYGSGELAQAFCRSAAVYGATYLLRRAAVGIVVNKDKNQVTGALLSTSNSCADDHNSDDPAQKIPKMKQVSCSHVIVSSGAFTDSSSSSPLPIRLETRKRVLRRISILRGKPLGANVQNRHVVIYPPGTFGNEDVIYALLLDETLNVAPHVPGGCAVVHLTTTTTTTTDDGDGGDKTDMLQQALDQILSESALHNDASAAVDEVFHMTFSYAMTAQAPSSKDSSLPQGLHISQRPPAPELAADPAFEEAARIFYQLVGPDVEFLAMSQAMVRAVEERIGDVSREDDDERMVLESAVNMISSSVAQEEGKDSAVPGQDDVSC